jgi:GNAT superfamily N-acetyltransferase
MINAVSVPLKSVRLSIRDGEKEIGRAWLVLVKNNLRKEPYGLLEDVWVDPDHRNQGHATMLVQAVIKQAKQEGCYKLLATSRFKRKKVHNLYKQIGFVSHGFEFRMNL